MEIYTVEEFQERFDEMIDRVEKGEHIGITDGKNSAVMIPADDELIRIHTDHEEGCWFKTTYRFYKLSQGNFYASETW